MSVSAAVQMIETLVSTKIGSALPFSATVSALSGGKVQITRLGASTPDSQLYAKLAGWQLSVGDEVVCLNFLGSTFVLGKVQRATPGTVATDGLLTLASLDGTDAANGDVLAFDGVAWAASAPSTLTANDLVIDNVSADAATTATTTAISTFQAAYTRAVTLPAGTWTVHAGGWLGLKNSAGNNGQLRLQIDGNAGGTRTVALVSGSYQTSMIHATQTNVAGGRAINVVLEYHGVTSGTTSAQNPALWIAAQRTAAGTTLLGGNIGQWTQVSATFSTASGDLVTGPQGSAYANATTIDLTQDWTLTATATMLAGAHSHDISLGVGSASAVLEYGVNLLSTASGGVSGYLYANGGDYAEVGGAAWSDGDAIAITLRWDASARTLAATVTQGARTESVSVLQTGTTAAHAHYPIVSAAGTSGDTTGLDVSAIALETA